MADVRDIPNVGPVWPIRRPPETKPRRKTPDKPPRDRERGSRDDDDDDAPTEDGSGHFDGYA